MKSGIYKITNSINGKFYIGSAKDIDDRWETHRQHLRGNYHINPKLQNAWNKYGEDKFMFELFEETCADQQILFAREQHYLNTLKPYERDIGYNICPTAMGGDNITHNPNREEFIKKMKIITAGENNGMYGKSHSEDAIEKQKEKAEGRYTLQWFIERRGVREGTNLYNTRRIMLSNRKITYSHPNINKGRQLSPMSEESKLKISETKEKMKTQKKFLIADIRSEKYTTIQLCEKYAIGPTAVKYYKSKIRNEI